jgi:hypothetical protein
MSTVFNAREMKLLQVWINNPALISISHAWPDTFDEGICEEYNLKLDELNEFKSKIDYKHTRLE